MVRTPVTSVDRRAWYSGTITVGPCGCCMAASAALHGSIKQVR